LPACRVLASLLPTLGNAEGIARRVVCCNSILLLRHTPLIHITHYKMMPPRARTSAAISFVDMQMDSDVDIEDQFEQNSAADEGEEGDEVETSTER